MQYQQKKQKGIICPHYYEVLVACEHLTIVHNWVTRSTAVLRTAAVEIGDVIETFSCVSDKKTKKQY